MKRRFRKYLKRLQKTPEVRQFVHTSREQIVQRIVAQNKDRK